MSLVWMWLPSAKGAAEGVQLLREQSVRAMEARADGACCALQAASDWPAGWLVLAMSY
jgi:hypothetical protein